MSAGAQQAFHLLRNNGPVGDLDRSAIIDGADGAVPGDNILKLMRKGPVIRGHHILTGQPAAAPGTQLRRNIIKICIAERHGDSFLQIGQHLPHTGAGRHLGLGLILDLGTVLFGVPVIDPAHLIGIGGQRHGPESGDLADAAAQRRKGLRPGTLPFLKEIPIDARDAPNQRRGAGTGLRIRQAGEGRAGLGEDISIAGCIDNRLGKDSLTALLTLKYYTLYSVPIHNGTYASTVVQHLDRLPLLQQHLIQFNF